MAKSKTKRKLWRRQTSSLTEKRDIETVASSSFNLVTVSTVDWKPAQPAQPAVLVDVQT